MGKKKFLEIIKQYVILETRKTSIKKARNIKLTKFAEVKKKRKTWLKKSLDS